MDLGTLTGWAWRAPDGAVTYGTWNTKPSRFDSNGVRFVKLREHLDAAFRRFGFQTVVYEAVRRHLGTDAAHAYGGYLATLQAWCHDHGIEYRGIAVATIKKAWTGKGNADKSAMIAECERRGFPVDDDNQADAIALLHLTEKP